MARLEGEALARFRCWRCSGNARTAEPTSVIVVGYAATPVVRLAHAVCAPSHVITLDAERAADREAGGV